jgi:hypothetical protein
LKVVVVVIIFVDNDSFHMNHVPILIYLT